jgi:hypothetical protein
MHPHLCQKLHASIWNHHSRASHHSNRPGTLLQRTLKFSAESSTVWTAHACASRRGSASATSTTGKPHARPSMLNFDSVELQHSCLAYALALVQSRNIVDIGKTWARSPSCRRLVNLHPFGDIALGRLFQLTPVLSCIKRAPLIRGNLRYLTSVRKRCRSILPGFLNRVPAVRLDL